MDDELSERLQRFSTRPEPPPPDIDAFDPQVLDPLALAAGRYVWGRRLVNEHGSAVVASRLRDLVTALALEESERKLLVTALERLLCDEERHHALARRMLLRLGAEDSPSVALPAPAAPHGAPVEQFARLVLEALVLGEGISAARYAMVRRSTDLPVPRALIELFLRDEVAHAELGLLLVPLTMRLLRASRHATDAQAFVKEVLRGAFAFLDMAVGQDAERKGTVLTERPQPENNPGVIEPALDAFAFYACVNDVLLPRLKELGTPADEAWRERFKPKRDEGSRTLRA